MRGLARPGERKRLFLACFSCAKRKENKALIVPVEIAFARLANLVSKSERMVKNIHKDLANREIVVANFLQPQNFSMNMHISS
jgi:hypothetical protein